jgi:hypothetical protein
MMLMQKAPQAELDVSFPQEYLQKLKEYRKQHSELLPNPGRKRKMPAAPNVFSSKCKQGISLANTRVYCCVLKEPVEGSICKVCPCHEPEPLEYTLYKRV